MLLMRWLSADESVANFEEGIGRMMNNRSFYVRLLTKFMASDSMEKLIASVAEGDPVKIAAEAHTLKGVASNLGLTALANSSASLDNAMRDGKIELKEELLAKVEECYFTTIAAITEFIK